MYLRSRWAKVRLTAYAAITGAIAVTSAVWAAPQPASAAGGLQVYVGYADNVHASAINFPTPWAGSPDVTFEGCLVSGCTFDGGAVRFVNNSPSPVKIGSISLSVDTCRFAMWSDATVAPGKQLIIAQNASGASNGCPSPMDGTMDTSDIGPNGQRWAGNCTNSGIKPVVSVSLDGGPAQTFTDAGQVLNTGGIDKASCPSGTNESTQWTLIGNAPCVGSTLTLAPPTQTLRTGDTATTTATLLNGCGTPLQGAVVNFKVTSGPDLGRTGTGTTDASGKANFSYTGAGTGTDTVEASTTNLAGTITSNPVKVIWFAPIKATGGFFFTGTEPATLTNVTVATFTDPDTSTAASSYHATIDWGDLHTSAGAVSGGSGSFTVTGSHTYADEGHYTITVKITDVTPANTATVFDRAVIFDAPLTAAGITPGPISGQTFSGPVATFTDANTTSTPADFTGTTINWGDGSAATSATITGGGGHFTVRGTHTYTGTGYFTVKVHIVDDGGSTANATTTLLIFASGLGGNFTVGYNAGAVGDNVVFWGYNWKKYNFLHIGNVPDWFYGWEDQATPPSCGGTWTTTPFNINRQPDAPLPAYIEVIVTDQINATLTHRAVGDVVHLVVVKTNPGYQPIRQYPGTGQVVATIC